MGSRNGRRRLLSVTKNGHSAGVCGAGDSVRAATSAGFDGSSDMGCSVSFWVVAVLACRSPFWVVLAVLCAKYHRGAGDAGAGALGPDGAGVAEPPAAGALDPAGAGAVPAGPLGAGALGAGAGAGGAAVPPTTELVVPRWPMIASASAPSMNSTANTVVIFESSVAPPRAPNAVWLLPPPNALAISPPFPCCSRITISRTRHTRT